MLHAGTLALHLNVGLVLPRVWSCLHHAPCLALCRAAHRWVAGQLEGAASGAEGDALEELLNSQVELYVKVGEGGRGRGAARAVLLCGQPAALVLAACLVPECRCWNVLASTGGGLLPPPTLEASQRWRLVTGAH